jgi:hypothetical protein
VIRATSTSASLPRSLRCVAALNAVAIWLLGVFAVSPELHAHLHDHAGHHGCDHAAPGEPDHRCAVTLFQQGVENPISWECGDLRPRHFTVANLAPVDRLAPPAADLRLRPGRGPPDR